MPRIKSVSRTIARDWIIDAEIIVRIGVVTEGAERRGCGLCRSFYLEVDADLRFNLGGRTFHQIRLVLPLFDGVHGGLRQCGISGDDCHFLHFTGQIDDNFQHDRPLDARVAGNVRVVDGRLLHYRRRGSVLIYVHSARRSGGRSVWQQRLGLSKCRHHGQCEQGNPFNECCFFHDGRQTCGPPPSRRHRAFQ